MHLNVNNVKCHLKITTFRKWAYELKIYDSEKKWTTGVTLRFCFFFFFSIKTDHSISSPEPLGSRDELIGLP